MNNKMTIGTLVISSFILLGCGSTNDTTKQDTETTQTTERFTFETISDDTLEKDNQTKLAWVGSEGADGNACQANKVADTEVGAVASANDHCNALVFAGYDDWRAPTAAEQSEMIKEMNKAGKVPFYTVPSCPRLMGVDGSTATAVNTHNVDPVGGLIPWSTLLSLTKTNYGVKCVRSF